MPKSRLQGKRRKHNPALEGHREYGVSITADTPLKTILAIGSECDRSGRCCRTGSGIVLREEIPAIAKKLAMSSEEFTEKYLTPFTNLNTTHYRIRQVKPKGKKTKRFIPHGRCVFLHENGRDCTIHEFKPLHCRATSCCSIHGEELSLWFLFNHFLNPLDQESVKEYEQYVKIGGKTLPGVKERIEKAKKRLRKRVRKNQVFENAEAKTSHDS